MISFIKNIKLKLAYLTFIQLFCELFKERELKN
jgi:hypothetical protein